MKGERGGNCNRTACQRPGAMYYSVWTRAYYCGTCARMINDANRDSAQELYGVDKCVFLVAELSPEDRKKLNDRSQYVPEV